MGYSPEEGDFVTRQQFQRQQRQFLHTINIHAVWKERNMCLQLRDTIVRKNQAHLVLSFTLNTCFGPQTVECADQHSRYVLEVDLASFVLLEAVILELDQLHVTNHVYF